MDTPIRPLKGRELRACVQYLDDVIALLKKDIGELIQERTLLADAASESRAYSSRTSENEKLQAVFSAISRTAKWNLPEFLYHTFRYQDENGQPVHRTTEHAGIVSRFLQGRTKYTPAMVLDAWFRGPDGSISKDCEASDLMYSTAVPFTEIQSVRPTMTSFAVQVVRQQVVREAEDAIKPTSGLHTSVKDKSNPKVMNWTDIGAGTTSQVAEILRKYQPITMDLMMQIAARPPHKRKGVVAVRKFRPVEVVSLMLRMHEYVNTY